MTEPEGFHVIPKTEISIPFPGGSSSLRTATSRDDTQNPHKKRILVLDTRNRWLLASPQILFCLAACFLNATLLISFDSVSG